MVEPFLNAGRPTTSRSNVRRSVGARWPPRTVAVNAGRSTWRRGRANRPVSVGGRPRPALGVVLPAELDELEAEAALHAQMAVRDRRLERRGHLHDPVVL